MIDLAPFTSPHSYDPRRLCAAVLACADKVYATDGAIVIEIDGAGQDCPQVQTHPGRHLLDKAFRSLSSHVFAALDPASLPPPTPCRRCAGTGLASKCRRCTGTGLNGNDEDSDDCPRCLDAGQTHPVDADTAEACNACEGRGQTRNAIAWPSADSRGQFDARYLRIVAALPDVRLAPDPQNPETAAALFAFTGGRGALMPVRPAQEKK